MGQYYGVFLLAHSSYLGGQVGAVGYEGRRGAGLRVDFRLLDLPLHPEIERDALFGPDGPCVILVERESRGERRAHVVRADQLDRTGDLADERLLVGMDAVDRHVVVHLVDAYFPYIGLLVEGEGDRAVRGIGRADRESLAFDVGNADFDDGIGHVVLDAGPEGRPPP